MDSWYYDYSDFEYQEIKKVLLQEYILSLRVLNIEGYFILFANITGVERNKLYKLIELIGW